MTQTFLWHDYETNGIDTVKDRAAQFAAIRTDMDLNEIGDPIEYYAIPHKDTLPNPIACLVTGITPNKIFRLAKDSEESSKVITEYDFFKNINKEFSVKDTCVVGYNNISYDDEVSRNGFYRNLMNPYSREYMNGCSRWDIMNVIRLFALMYPNDIVVPMIDGKPSFRLELLTHENGIGHEKAHDAVSDVRATIAMAKFMKDKHPDFWDYCFKNRNKSEMKSIVELKKPILYVSPFFGSSNKYSEFVYPIASNPSNPNEYFLIKLTQDINELKKLISEDADEIKRVMYLKKDELGENVRPPIHTLQVNKCPVVIDVVVLRKMLNLNKDSAADFFDSLGFSQDVLRENLKWVQENEEQLKNKLYAIYKKEEFPITIDPDLAIYSSFFNSADSRGIDEFHKNLEDREVTKYFEKNHFQDPRYDILARRIVLRNYPDLIELPKIKEGWIKHCANRLTLGYSILNQQSADNIEKTVSLTFSEFFQELKNSESHEKYDKNIIDELSKYGERLAKVLDVKIESVKEAENEVSSEKSSKRKPSP